LSVLAVGLATLAGAPAAAAAGVVLALAVSVKLTAITAIPPVVWFARAHLRALFAGAAAAAAVVLLLHVDALGALWSSSVTYHEHARSTPAVLPHPDRRIFTQMPIRTPFVWLTVAALVAGAVATLAFRRRTRVWPLWTWVALSLAFLLAQKPLHDNHLVLLPGTLAIAAGATLATALPRHRLVVAIVALLLVGAYAQQWRRVTVARVPEPSANVAASHAVARLTPSGALTVDDRPIISFLARREVVGPLVDLAKLRFETGSLTQTKVIADLAGAHTAVVSRQLRDEPSVLAYLHRAFVRRYSAGGIDIYVRR
jgi:hypothetical protein